MNLGTHQYLIPTLSLFLLKISPNDKSTDLIYSSDFIFKVLSGLNAKKVVFFLKKKKRSKNN